jgi:hypothetical protein
MDNNLEQLKKILKKAHSLEVGKEITLAKEFISIDDKIDKVGEDLNTKISDLSDSLKKKLDEELVYEVDEEKIVNSVLSKVEIPDPIKGDKGDDYILTAKDKKDIAKSIKVPIVEKVIERIETIVEQPIVTNEIKEVAIPVLGEEIVDKINELPLEDEFKIDASHIKNLPETKGGKWYGGSGIKEIIAGAGISVDNSRLGYPEISAPGSTTDEKVKYNASDISAGYLADKVVAGTGITLSEGTGGDADKLQITNTLDLSGYVPYTGATTNVDLGTHTLTTKELNVNTNGDNALFSTFGPNGVGDFNIWIGNGGQNSTAPDGQYNTSLGFDALVNNTGGYENMAIGNSALRDNTVGYSNVAIGSGALMLNDSGGCNMAIGSYTLQNNLDGNNNIAIGNDALFNNDSGSGNMAIGVSASENNIIGNYNVAVGYYAGWNLLGNSNIMLGTHAGAYETGSNSFYVDNQDRVNTAGDKAGALLYGTFNAVPANQTLTINATTTVSKIIGGSSTTSTLTLQSTSGVGTTGADIIFKVGNNGATEAMRIANSSLVTINSAATIGAGVYTQASYLKIGAQGDVSALVEPFAQINTIALVGTGGGQLKVRNGSLDTAILLVNSISASNFKAGGNQPTIFSTTDSSGASGRYAQAFFGGTAVYNDAYRVKITPAETTHIGLIVKGLASQSGNLTEWQNSSGTILSSVASGGNFGIGTNASSSGILHVRGAGATKATTALYVDNSTPAQILKLNNDGGLAVGLSTTLTGANSIVMGQYSQATGGNSVAIGYAQRATATGALCISANAGSGYSEASGPWSTLVGGELNKAAGRYSTLIGGRYGYTTMYNQITFGHDRLVAGTGSFQTSIIPLSASITGTAQTELFIPSLASGQAILPVQSWETNPTYTVWNVTVILNAFTASVGNGTGTQNHVFGGEYRCIVRRAFGSTTVTMVGSGVQTIYEDADTTMADAVVTIDGDSTTGALRVRFTPPTTAGSTTNTRVACSINYLQTSRE